MRKIGERRHGEDSEREGDREGRKEDSGRGQKRRYRREEEDEKRGGNGEVVK